MYQVTAASEVIDSLNEDWRSFATANTNHTPARVVLEHNQPLAIGTFWRNPLHPNPFRFEYRLGNDRDVGALTPLLAALTTSAESDASTPIHFIAREQEFDLVAWAHAHDFKQIMKTWNAELLPNSVKAPAFDGIHRLVDTDSTELRHRLALLHAQIYSNAHHWNPPGSSITESAELLFMGEDVLPEFLWYVTDQAGEPIGVSSLRRSDLPAHMELGWLGTCPDVSEEIHRRLLDTALAAAGDNIVLIETDANESRTLARLRELPVDWGHAMIRFERRVLT
ncbi:MAG: hypothetical protein KC435_12895 [Thermomicrobiales bacterium]|nr:hypothetical protein [Thermomicrobiales bacterium]